MRQKELDERGGRGAVKGEPEAGLHTGNTLQVLTRGLI